MADLRLPNTFSSAARALNQHGRLYTGAVFSEGQQSPEESQIFSQKNMKFVINDVFLWENLESLRHGIISCLTRSVALSHEKEIISKRFYDDCLMMISE